MTYYFTLELIPVWVSMAVLIGAIWALLDGLGGLKNPFLLGAGALIVIAAILALASLVLIVPITLAFAVVFLVLGLRSLKIKPKAS